MNLKLLLFIFPTVVSTDIIVELLKIAPADTPQCFREFRQLIKCVEPHEALINSALETVNEETVYNIGFMNKALQIGRNVSECLGHNFTCDGTKLVVYGLDYADYIGKKVYGDVFHCFINAQTFELLQICQRDTYEPGPTNQVEDVTVVNNITNTLFECVARKMYSTPSCTVDRIVSLYQAGKALIDAAFEFYRWNAKYPVEWEYDAGKYCDN
ncbi:hypothetical protein CAEBREN_25761 [Caenorhabditis brenneri]|uniref:DUF19 domain-containing protein n=1 Tax=Caenorhabditis brenneri TaxID=135651 RepID=G0NC58_CAEBE|nr:hypothetical protein CAEBREN_25761 [Caenorhabditis brenneri]